MAFDIEITTDTKEDALLFKIALGLLEGIGPVLAKRLVAYCGGVEAVFRESKKNLRRIPDIGPTLSASVVNKEVLKRAEEELQFIDKHRINSVFFLDEDYPTRLKNCEDSPLMLFCKGKMNLNAQKVVSIVGTRKASAYGKRVCEEIVEGLAAHEDVLISSGLAYGVDICAHKAALKNNVQTVGVLAHGLDMIYPPPHRDTACLMMENGGVVTELTSGNKPERAHFPQRNRIVAGMADATLVIESARGGGSMITANLASSYNRDVLALPGRATDEFSTGCNLLIKSHRAALVESIQDLEYALGWDQKPKNAPKQTELFVNLKPDEKQVCEYLKQHGETPVDVLCLKLQLSASKAASLLLSLEFKGLVRSLPGKRFNLG